MTQPTPGAPVPWPTPAGASTPRPGGASTGGVIVAVVLLLVALMEILVTFVLTMFLAMSAGGCGSLPCNDDLVSIGGLVALWGPSVVIVPAIVWSIVLLVRRRKAWIAAVVAVVGGAGAWALGAFLVVMGTRRPCPHRTCRALVKVTGRNRPSRNLRGSRPPGALIRLASRPTDTEGRPHGP